MTTFSVVIPTYNEAKDIMNTLAHLWDFEQVIVVDSGSTDGTLNKIVESCPWVQLISTPRMGRGEARNLGLKWATEDVVIFLNADVEIRPGFQSTLADMYDRTPVDFVIPDCRVSWFRGYGAYIQRCHDQEYTPQEQEWSEGFSVRREAALAVGGFPECPIPLTGGEDGYFGKKLLDAGYRRGVGGIVFHVAPATLREFWAQQKERGRATPLILVQLYHHSFVSVVCRACLRVARNVVVGPLECATLGPVHFVALAARTVGEWKGIWDLLTKLPMYKDAFVETPER